MNSSQSLTVTRRSVVVLTIAVLVTSLVAVSIGYVSVLQKLNDLQNQVSSLRASISLSQLYENVRNSVVMIRGLVYMILFGQQVVQGSGYVYNFSGRMVIITNFHVIDEATDISVTFVNGNAYNATVLGSDRYYDLAVLSVNAPASEFKPLQVVSSSTLKVGDPIIAIGNPFGLTGSMTTGIVSQLGRTITESTTGFSIANIIQISAPINQGNSGGPLLNDKGQVVGVTAAIVAGSQGVGFAIPSNAILREMASLVNNGSYTQHSWLGISGTDMTYEIANKMNLNITYGVLITEVIQGGPAENAGIQSGTQQVVIGGSIVTIGGDIIIAINGTRIINVDDLSTYLEENTLPDQTISIRIVRNSSIMTVSVVLGTRPSPS